MTPHTATGSSDETVADLEVAEAARRHELDLKRKLAAILVADVAGFSTLVANDEEATLRRLDACRIIFSDSVARHRGRIFNTAGDAVLAEFQSAVSAVRCAVEVQEALRARNATAMQSSQMHFRIGITVGDVVERGGDLLGDGVNVAARLEGMAPAGGICVTRTVYEQVGNKLGLAFQDLGLRQAKNIPQPVHVFALAAPGTVIGEDAPARIKAPLAHWGWAERIGALGLPLALVMAVGGVVGSFAFMSKLGTATRTEVTEAAATAKAKVASEQAASVAKLAPVVEKSVGAKPVAVAAPAAPSSAASAPAPAASAPSVPPSPAPAASAIPPVQPPPAQAAAGAAKDPEAEYRRLFAKVTSAGNQAALPSLEMFKSHQPQQRPAAVVPAQPAPSQPSSVQSPQAAAKTSAAAPQPAAVPAPVTVAAAKDLPGAGPTRAPHVSEIVETARWITFVRELPPLKLPVAAPQVPALRAEPVVFKPAVVTPPSAPAVETPAAQPVSAPATLKPAAPAPAPVEAVALPPPAPAKPPAVEAAKPAPRAVEPPAVALPPVLLQPVSPPPQAVAPALQPRQAHSRRGSQSERCIELLQQAQLGELTALDRVALQQECRR